MRSISNSGSSVGENTRLLGLSGLSVFLLVNMCSESELSGVVDLQQLDSSVVDFFLYRKLDWVFYDSDDVFYSVIEFIRTAVSLILSLYSLTRRIISSVVSSIVSCFG